MKTTTKYVAFPNKYKEENAKAPDYKIYLDHGKEGQLSKYSIGAMWVGKSAKGNTFISIAIDSEEYKPVEGAVKSTVKELAPTTLSSVQHAIEEQEEEDEPVVGDLPF